ncbi:hypothetical protein [Bacillus atrophaeus]|uniref:hypothetical protein n=1 Tax=Bacillus atrophaeus TaxID=1452 RepID=UPI00227FB38F|nr:hypothetical protein [Bacillus atrophaeus]MCY8516995.1 hypothetical protein [Bacillus atrophaeus]
MANNSGGSRTDDTSLVFQTEPIGQPNHVEITLVSFYELHHQRYSIYWYLMNEEEYLHFKDEEKEKQEKLRRITVDEVQPNEQQPRSSIILKKRIHIPVI